MDPNKTLEQMRADMVSLGTLQDDSSELLDRLLDIAEAAQALDEWLTHGGFLPTEWQK